MLHSEGRTSHAWGRVSLGEVVMCLTDLIDFFQQPKVDEGTDMMVIFNSPFPAIDNNTIVVFSLSSAYVLWWPIL